MIKRKKILLAEDEKNLIEILLYLLRSWDYEVIVVSDSTALLEKVKREMPDLVIIDSNLPRMDGLKVCKILKEDFLTAYIPTIILIDKRQIRRKMLEIEKGVDDYILKPPDPIDLEVRIEMALRRTEHQLYANALTKLPGNKDIERIINTRLREDSFFSIAYYDIDNFKSFNDKYGYFRGDLVIKQTAYIISTIVKRIGNIGDFVGHIGGDDFIIVTTPEKERLIASETILEFDRLIPFHYSKDDRERGFVTLKDRTRKITNIPLMTVSISIVSNKNLKINGIVELMETTAEIKKYLKSLPGSNFLINRRVSDSGVQARQAKEAGLQPAEIGELKKNRLKSFNPLGQILLESKSIKEEDLIVALQHHWNTGQRLGQCMIDIDIAGREEVAKALERQFNVPHFNIREFEPDRELISKIPIEIIKLYNLIPVKKDRTSLYLAMTDPTNFNEVQKKIKNLTGYNTIPLFVLEDEFKQLLNKSVA